MILSECDCMQPMSSAVFTHFCLMRPRPATVSSCVVDSYLSEFLTSISLIHSYFQTLGGSNLWWRTLRIRSGSIKLCIYKILKNDASYIWSYYGHLKWSEIILTCWAFFSGAAFIVQTFSFWRTGSWHFASALNFIKVFSKKNQLSRR